MELRSSEERYRTFTPGRPPYSIPSIARGRIISVTDFWLENMGYERSEVIGHESTEFMTEAPARLRARLAWLNSFSTSDIPGEFVRRRTIIETLLFRRRRALARRPGRAVR